MDACGGESNSEHVLLRGNVVWGRDAVQVTHVADGEKKKVSERVAQQETSNKTYCVCLQPLQLK